MMNYDLKIFLHKMISLIIEKGIFSNWLRGYIASSINNSNVR